MIRPKTWKRLLLGLSLAAAPQCADDDVTSGICNINADCPPGQFCVAANCQFEHEDIVEADVAGVFQFPDGVLNDVQDSSDWSIEKEIAAIDQKISDSEDLDHITDSYNSETAAPECYSAAECNDSNPCTIDTCDESGNCVYNDEKDGVLCKNGELCTLEAACIDGKCQQTLVIECKPSKTCIKSDCDPQTGQCVESPMDDGSPCDNGDSCTENETCVRGGCVGTEIVCNDNDPCTTDECDPQSGCVFAPMEDGAICAMSTNPCFSDDVCSAGVCVPGAALCDCLTDSGCLPPNGETPLNLCDAQLACDMNEHVCVIAKRAVECATDADTDCLSHVCNPTSGRCVEEFVAGGIQCNDGTACTQDEMCDGKGGCVGLDVVCDDENPCTQDGCDPLTGCAFTNQDGGPCDDGNKCTVGDACLGGSCHSGPAASCSDGVACTADSCNPDVGCVFVAVDAECNDNNPCTSDTCGVTGCEYATTADNCDDGNVCTLEDVCQSGKCTGGKPLECDDGNVCTVDSCDAALGCTYKNVQSTTDCDDANACTQNDQCFAGTCVGEAVDCNDGNVCTVDACDTALGCMYKNAQSATFCDDMDACTANDHCSAGTCVGDVVGCDDGNPCTTDGCTIDTGCTHQNNTNNCDDDNACTTKDTCLNGVCQGGPTVACVEDENPCTVVGCNPVVGCTTGPTDGNCDDSDPCTVGDYCYDGQCTPGPGLNCDDGNPCTKDSCTQEGNCLHNTAAMTNVLCDDNNVCTVGTKCISGICAGFDTTCNDQNPCTTDSCDPKAGCVFTPNTKVCSDNNVCTMNDHCDAGVCKAGTPLVCDDNNVCTSDSCDSKKGCVFVTVTTSCDDGNACTAGDVCVGGVCQPGKSLVCDAPGHCATAGCDPACVSNACDTVKGCTFTPINGGCNDGDLCTWGDQCVGGKCEAGIEADCNDQNVCTDDLCLPEFGCGNFPNAGMLCEDGNLCTNNVCDEDGNCSVMGAVQCQQLPCLTLSCLPVLGCTVTGYLTGACDDGNSCTENEFCTGGKCNGQPLSCDDNNPCTVDACVVVSETENACTHEPLDGQECTTGNVCGHSGICNGETCVEMPVSCPEPDLVGTECGAVPCDSECVASICQHPDGCSTVLLSGLLCDDGNPCTSNDECLNGVCVGTSKVCTSTNPCFAATCDPKVGQCTNTQFPNGFPCEDGNKCTVMDTCQDGGCKSGGPPVECIDGDPCTQDVCVLEGGSGLLCINPPEPDGKVCNNGATQGVCLNGGCE